MYFDVIGALLTGSILTFVVTVVAAWVFLKRFLFAKDNLNILISSLFQGLATKHRALALVDDREEFVYVPLQNIAEAIRAEKYIDTVSSSGKSG